MRSSLLFAVCVVPAALLTAGCSFGYERLGDGGLGLGGALGSGGGNSTGGTVTSSGGRASGGSLPSGGQSSAGGSAATGGAAAGGASGGQNAGGGAGGQASGGQSAGGSAGGQNAGGSSGGQASGGAGAGGSGGAPVSEFGEATGSLIAHCQQLPALAAPPVIDGMIDPGMYLEEVPTTSWTNTTDPVPTGQRMRFSIAWRPDGFYFFAVVDDPDRNPAAIPADPNADDRLIYQGDGVEFYFDHDGVFPTTFPFYDTVGTRQFLLSAPPDDSTNSTRAQVRLPETYTLWSSGTWVVKPISTGYVAEGFVDGAWLYAGTLALTSGMQVGIDVAHNVSVPIGGTGTSGNRLGQYFHQVIAGSPPTYPFDQAAAFCKPTLLP